VDAVECSSLAAVREAVGEGEAVWADLSLGAWTGHQAGRELLAQLTGRKLCPRGTMPAPGDAADFPSYAELVGQGIDAEALGRGEVLRAHAMAQRVAKLLGTRTVVILAPREGFRWEEENEFFVRFLGEALRGKPHRLVMVQTKGGAEKAPVAGLLPGVVSAELMEAIRGEATEPGWLHPVAGGFLVAPEVRPARVGLRERLRFDRLATLTREFPGIALWAQMYGNSFHVEAGPMADQAWQEFRQGGVGVALRLMARAEPCARNPTERAILQAKAQGMRIAAHRFDEAAASSDPGLGLPANLRSFLLEAKGWGLAMSREPERAVAYLEQARDLEVPGRDPREHHYLLNILALGCFRSGAFERALSLEKEIEAALERQTPADWRLGYVNAINLARLYARAGDAETALRYYERAFATTQGIWSESDRFYQGITLGRAFQAAGRREESLAAWLRAGLHWLACKVPESLSRRSLRPLAGDPEEALEREIAGAAARAGCDVPLLEAAPQVAARMGCAPAGSWLAAAQGWAVVATPGDLAERGTRLRRRVWSVLRALAPEAFPESPSRLLVDRDIAQTWPQAIEMALRVGASQVRFEERRMDNAAEWMGRLSVEVGPAVERIDGGTVFFRRYHPPRKLGRRTAQLLAGPIRYGELDGTGRRLVRVLEAAGILRVRLKEGGA
jgi:tetratricopeptide (TPR) repeat protein